MRFPWYLNALLSSDRLAIVGTAIHFPGFFSSFERYAGAGLYGQFTNF